MLDYSEIISRITDEKLRDIDNETTRQTLKTMLIPIGNVAFWCGYYKADIEIRTRQHGTPRITHTPNTYHYSSPDHPHAPTLITTQAHTTPAPSLLTHYTTHTTHHTQDAT
jgi:hypothetical protein